jgi:hypothetical protein
LKALQNEAEDSVFKNEQ